MRYVPTMFLLAAAAIAASSPGSAPERTPVASVRATASATASVRILSSVGIRWGEPSADLPRMRLTQLRGSGGDLQPIRLIEFE